MKKILFFISLCYAGLIFSQKNFNQFSIEAGYGFVSPINGYSTSYGSSFSGFKNFDFGVRYMINETYGLKAGYVNSLFESNRNNGFGSKMNTITLQGYLNLAYVLDFGRSFDDTLGLLFHTGTGYSTMSSNIQTGQDQVYSFIAGITPQYKLSNKIAFYIDFSYYYNTSHDFNYDGTKGASNDGKFKTQMYTISLGLILSLGSNGSHADWY